MKGIIIALLILIGGQVDAATLDKPLQTQEMSGKWAHFRDKHLLGRETENERRDRKEWERRHREDRRRHHDDYRYTPPPPPPYYRDGRRYYPPPQSHRDGRRYYPPNPPPTRYR